MRFDTRAITALAGAIVLSGVLACPVALAAGPRHPPGARSASTEGPAWSIELDCSECHASQAADLAVSDEEGTAGGEGGAVSGMASSTGDAPEAADAEGSARTGGLGGAQTAIEMTGREGYIASHVAFGLECATCHEDSDKLASAHKQMGSGKEPDRLKKTGVDDAICMQCHNLGDLADKTTECTALTDSNGTVVNPHDIPQNAEHASVTCMSCHHVHDMERSLAQTAKQACTSCHHADVFECGTCHE